MEESRINFDNVLELLRMVRDTSDTEDNDEIIESSQTTPRKVTRSTASKVVDSVSVITNLYNKMTGGKSDEKVERESVPSVINCLVKVLSGFYKTLSNQGKQIKEIFEELKSEKTHREKLLEQIQQKYKDMERKDRENLEKIINEKVEKTEIALV